MNFWHRRGSGPPRNSYFSEQEFNALRAAAFARFPSHSGCEPLNYPGAETLPIYILPLAYPLAPELQIPIETLHDCMLQDHVQHGYLRPDVDYEHRQGHLWVVVLDDSKYLPIGQTIFLAEATRPAEKDLPTPEPPPAGGLRLKLELAPEKKKTPTGQWQDEALIAQWWLFYSWIKPAYRQHQIFKCSVDYFSAWHPGFVLREREPHLMGALRGHPEHLPKNVATIWA